jgi:L-ascorbate metabolism protein UlaG (beta-lactamase superfamily)
MERFELSIINKKMSLPMLFVSVSLAFSANAEELSAERLTWAGVKLVHEDTTVFIDAVGTDLWNGNAPQGLVPVESTTRRTYALITHSHNDHFDPDTLKRVLGDKGYVICHESIATYVASRGLKVIPVKTWEPVTRGGFIFTAVPANDGLGAEQVSWVVKAGEKKVFHGGDTLWHGKLELIGQQFGPFDAAFLPINGAKLQREPAVESSAVLNPQQAIDTAVLLYADRIVPIHFGLNDPPYYIEVENPLETLAKEASHREMTVTQLKPGEHLKWE